MNRGTLFVAALLLAVAAPASAHTRTYFGFHIGIASAPPPPPLVFYEPPPVVVVPSTQVYVISGGHCDYDVFRYGPYWYLSYEGYWYRARRHGGPFRAIDVRHVPRPIFHVPARHWKHREWGPTHVRAHSASWKGHQKHKHRHGHDD